MWNPIVLTADAAMELGSAARVEDEEWALGVLEFSKEDRHSCSSLGDGERFPFRLSCWCLVELKFRILVANWQKMKVASAHKTLNKFFLNIFRIYEIYLNYGHFYVISFPVLNFTLVYLVGIFWIYSVLKGTQKSSYYQEKITTIIISANSVYLQSLLK